MSMHDLDALQQATIVIPCSNDTPATVIPNTLTTTFPHINTPPATSALYALCLCLELLLLGVLLLDTIYEDLLKAACGFYFSGSQLIFHLGA